ncbi:hypothetical protein SISSUDRAFT_1010908 [Sistotremastrum suecicum HHB10207 ss-3]|uniref:Uncharacterized protein n=1 Tax=Sistotremastrum suecicum HHB10207 ss-3 TaxID=1314776 RepID=A0A165YQA4_9AGAM|nr:hypothetical protein SISSUDRAFT_1010908 [Sistotremastrum suecicum HHB10207 ss-3]
MKRPVNRATTTGVSPPTHHAHPPNASMAQSTHEDEEDDEDEDESDSDESTDDELEEKVSNPCEDIRAGLVAAFNIKSTSTTQGTFAFSKSYQDAPVPGLRVLSLGRVALPLDKNSAQKLIGVCTPAPFGKGERKIVDKNARDTWELTPDKVSFDDGDWDSWLKTTVIPQVNRQLGVSSTVGCEFYKLLVYEQGSHSLPHQDTEKSKGMFGTLIIVLPSAFQGGQLHVSHSGEKKIFDIAEDSKFSTSVMAWYSDVRHEVKHITSGYRLVLCYNLIAPTGSPRPGLPDHSQTVSAVRHVLMSWRQNFAGSTPDKLAYTLSHKYSSFGLGIGVLKGADAQKVDILRSLAKKCRFKIYLASVRLHLIGGAEGYDGYYGDDDTDDEHKRDMESVSKENLTIENVVDLDGEKPGFTGGDLVLKNHYHFLPCLLDAGKPDREEYHERGMANEGEEIEYWFRHNVILIWPRNRHGAVLGVDWLARAFGRLVCSTSTSATPREQKLMERVLVRIESEPSSDKYFPELFKAAIRWKDIKLWLHIARVAKIETRPSVLTCQQLTDAAVALGFDKLQPLMTNIIFLSPSNAYRFNLVAVFAESKLSKQADVAAWCDAQRQLIIETLKVATQDDVQPLIAIARSKGISFIQSRITPQLLSLDCKRSFWFTFLEELVGQRDAIGPSAQKVADVVKATLTSLLQKLDPLTLKPRNRRRFYESTHEYDTQATIQLLKTCFKLDCSDLASIVLGKLMRKNNEGDERIRKLRTSQVYQPVMTALISFTKPPYSINLENPPYADFIKMMATDVVDISLGRWNTDWGAAIHATKILKAQGIALLSTKVMAYLKQRDINADFPPTMARLLKKEWPYSAATEEGAAVQKLIQNLVIAALSRAKVLFEEYKIPSYLRSHPDFLRGPKDLLLLCLDTNNAALASRLLTRLRAPKKDEKQHFTDVAVPFIRILCTELVSRRIQISSDPYGEFCHDVLVAFVDKVLGPRPPANGPPPRELLAQMGCQGGCKLCNDMIGLLTREGSELTIEIRRPEKDRKHLQRQAAASRLGFTFDTIRDHSPYGLQITKPASLTALPVWNDRKNLVCSVIKDIHHKELQGILRDDYGRIMALLGLATVPPIPGANPTAPTEATIPSGQPTQQHPQTNTERTQTKTASAPGPVNSSGSAPTGKENKRPASTFEILLTPRKRRKTNSATIVQVDPCIPSPTFEILLTPRKPRKTKSAAIIDLCSPSPVK